MCNKCHPQVRNAKPSSTTTTGITRVNRVFKCKLCKFISKTKFSLKRHIETIHGGNQEKNEVAEESQDMTEETLEPEESERTIASAPRLESLQEAAGIERLLMDGGLPHLIPVMKQQRIDIEIIHEMGKDDFLEIGITSFGDRHKLAELLTTRQDIRELVRERKTLSKKMGIRMGRRSDRN